MHADTFSRGQRAVPRGGVLNLQRDYMLSSRTPDVPEHRGALRASDGALSLALPRLGSPRLARTSRERQTESRSHVAVAETRGRGKDEMKYRRIVFPRAPRCLGSTCQKRQNIPRSSVRVIFGPGVPDAIAVSGSSFKHSPFPKRSLHGLEHFILKNPFSPKYYSHFVIKQVFFKFI